MGKVVSFILESAKDPEGIQIFTYGTMLIAVVAALAYIL